MKSLSRLFTCQDFVCDCRRTARKENPRFSSLYEEIHSKYVGVMGSSVPQQCLRAGLLDEIQIHLVPILLGTGVRLFDHLGPKNIELENTKVVVSLGITRLRFRVVK